MLSKEKLIALGLSEEQVTQVQAVHKEAIDGNYVPKATFDSEREKVKTLNEQVTSRDTQITELGKFKGTAEELQTKVVTLEEANKTAQAQYDTKLAQIEKSSAITLEISQTVNDVDDVLPRLDLDKVIVKDGKIVSGLEEQVAQLKTSKPHYFKTAQTTETAKPSGWLFGKTPDENMDTTQPDTPQAKASLFGKTLAQSTLDQSEAIKKVSEAYFK